jgi:8-oxo-dGTP pyrophosphatase MutT (NUDIX family)
MKNFPIVDTKTGKEYWISRSVAVLTFVIARDEEGYLYILATQRGKGTPDPEYVGAYCLPCGYVDYDETVAEAAVRELKEETGIIIPANHLTFKSYNDNPLSDKRQNITFRFEVWLRERIQDLEKKLSSRYSEKDEVSDIRFIKLKDIYEYNWAFNHKELIRKEFLS